MHYQIQCPCGHRFFVRELKAVSCPDCNRPLLPTASAPAPATEPVSEPTKAEATKRCQFCGEVILAIARKCRYCNEFLDRSAPAAQATPEQTAGAAKTESEAEPVFVLSVSQWDNTFKFIICFTIAFATFFGLHVFKSPYEFPAGLGISVLMAFVMYYFYLAAKSSRCIIRPANIETQTGIISRHIDTLELWRVLDIDLKQSGLERILGIGTVTLKTTDDKTPVLELYQIPKAKSVFKYLQEQVPLRAKERGVVYVEK